MDIDRITLEQLSEEQRNIADIIGAEAYGKLVEYFGGGPVYICKAATVMKIKRDNEICQKFNGYNYRELAKEYGLSTKTIRDITKAIRNMPDDEQLTLLD